ncbi:hypothetical protein HDU93_005583 [Gonapodya sp. JEL0774]|nr:hypothetical protein HDU93_005583 [Gonapodya sp. JEL0774]
MAPSRKRQKKEDRGEAWYQDAERYWASVPPTVDGVLGGFASLSDPDAKGNAEFVAEFFDGAVTGNDGRRRAKMGRDRACDCGAGIGRVTLTFLLPHFHHIDLVEVSSHFLETAKTYLAPHYSDDPVKSRVTLVNSGLQDWTPQGSIYDAVWCQWVLGHLRDGGLLFVKENVTSGEEAEIDEVDSSVTRSESLLKSLFARAGMCIVKEQVQKGFPKGIYKVKMFALEAGAEVDGEGDGK